MVQDVYFSLHTVLHVAYSEQSAHQTCSPRPISINGAVSASD